jgi:hypothetical protein
VKTTGRSDKDAADPTVVATITKALCGTLTDKKTGGVTFSVTVDDVVWDNVKFVSVAAQYGGHMNQLQIQIF